MNSKKLPIGYWVKRVDQLLTAGINDIQSEYGLNRNTWQILNAVSESGGILKTSLLEVMHPFLEPSAIEKTLEALMENSLISLSGEEVYLTTKGREQHAACLELQKAFRQAAMETISAADYETTVKTLQSIAGNLQDRL